MGTGNLLLSFSAPAILLGIAGIFVKRRFHVEFPLFFAYILYSAAVGILREAAIQHRFFYYWLYWITEAIYGIAEVLVIREVFRRIFALQYATWRWFRLILPGTVLLILALSLWQTLYHPLRHGIPWEVNAIYWFDLGVHLVEGIILVLLLALTRLFPVAWRRYEFGILTGFGVAATVTMFAYLARFEGGVRYELFFRYGPPVGYIVATLLWLDAFARPLRQRSRTSMDPEELQGIVRSYRRLLEKIKRAVGLKQGSPEIAVIR
jgi:hypothetical protein